MPRRTSVDRRLFNAINGLPHTAYFDEQVALLSDLGKGAGWVAGAAWLAARDGSRGRRAALASIGAMLLAVGLVQGPIKGTLRRRRPFVREVARVVGRRPRDTSFPSGHTAGSFAAAAVLSAFYPRDRPLLVGTAAAVGVSRVYLGLHFPSDVLVGAGLGAALGLLGRRLVRRPAVDSGVARSTTGRT
jgi:undecaprenyl-diphosphatase